MNPRPTPRRVIVSIEEQSLTLDWVDGHRSTFPLDGLRRACPCASCQGGHENMGSLPDPDVFLVPSLMQWRDVRLAPAGGYALRITWDDGHDAGIHTWERLRRMCPCEECLGVSSRP